MDKPLGSFERQIHVKSICPSECKARHGDAHVYVLHFSFSQISYSIVDGMFDQVPPLCRGVLLEVSETLEEMRNGPTAELSEQVSFEGSRLLDGSWMNLNSSLRHRR